MMIIWPNWKFLVLSGTTDVGEKDHDNIYLACVHRGGGGQLVRGFPKDNCKPDIWCRKVPFIWAGVMEVGGDDAQVPLWWSQTQYFSRMSSLFSRNPPPTILNTLFYGDDFHNAPTKCFWRKESYWAIPTFYFWYRSIDKSNSVIGWLVGVWVGGILGKRNQELHTGFSYFR